jgi:sugar phosphate permease
MGEAPKTIDSDVSREFRRWQIRILIAALIGYALYYFVRKNLSVAMPAMEKDLGITKTDLGLFLTLHGLFYGVSKFINGMFVDRLNARWFMAAGLAASALLNVAFGFSSSVVLLGIIWTVNGWVQGFGFPPAARLMTHWFSPKELATKMSIWNVSHSIGLGLVVVLCGYLIGWGWGWRWCFYIPAGLAFVGSVYLAVTLRDTPESLGLPEVAGSAGGDPADEPVGLWQTLIRYVFSNPWIWLVSFANFFVYIVRYGLIDWGPSFLQQARHLTPEQSGWLVMAIEIGGGALGMVSCGWLTDRVFGGRGARTCVFYMILCTACLVAFQSLPPNAPFAVEAALLIGAGFALYGPQALVGIIGANLGTKKAAATAGGFTGMFGYFSTVVSGVGVGVLWDKYKNWDIVYNLFIVSSIAGIVVFALCWNAPAHGYKKQ